MPTEETDGLSWSYLHSSLFNFALGHARSMCVPAAPLTLLMPKAQALESSRKQQQYRSPRSCGSNRKHWGLQRPSHSRAKIVCVRSAWGIGRFPKRCLHLIACLIYQIKRVELKLATWCGGLPLAFPEKRRTQCALDLLETRWRKTLPQSIENG